MGILVQHRNQTCICWTDDMNIEIVRLVFQETMINGWRNKEKVLLHVFDWSSRQVAHVVDETCCCSKIVRLDHLQFIVEMNLRSSSSFEVLEIRIYQMISCLNTSQNETRHG